MENVENGNFVDNPTGEMPEIVEHEDGTVSIKGQEPEKPEVTEPQPTEPETPVVEETSAEPEPHPYDKAFIERGLNKQFPGGVTEVITRIPDMNKYITTLEQANAAYRRQYGDIAQPKREEPPPPTADDFMVDPVNAVTRIFENKWSQVQERLDNMEVKAFRDTHKDYNDLLPVMNEKLAENPRLAMLGIEAIPVLYTMAKAEKLSQAAQTTQPKAPAVTPDKARAVSSAGGKKTVTPARSVEDWMNMSTKDIEKEIGFAPEQ